MIVKQFFENVGTSTQNIVHVVTDDVTDEFTNKVEWVIGLCQYIEILLSGMNFIGINRTLTRLLFLLKYTWRHQYILHSFAMNIFL